MGREMSNTTTNTKYIEELSFGTGTGSPVIDCTCGRINFADDSYLMEAGEHRRLRMNAEANPKAYCRHTGYDCVSSIELEGSPRVFGCDCHWEERLQRMLDMHQGAFIQYYKNKIKREAEAQARSVKELQELGP
jgi:hypothetical protein